MYPVLAGSSALIQDTERAEAVGAAGALAKEKSEAVAAAEEAKIYGDKLVAVADKTKELALKMQTQAEQVIGLWG